MPSITMKKIILIRKIFRIRLNNCFLFSFLTSFAVFAEFILSFEFDKQLRIALKIILTKVEARVETILF